MNKDKFLQLHKQYCLDTALLSFTKTDHPAYIELLTLKNQYGIVWALERLKASIGHDVGDTFDHDNSPWLSIHLLDEYSDMACLKGFPKEHAGKLNEVRDHIIQWGKNENYI
jgi:hypothetical protein